MNNNNLYLLLVIYLFSFILSEKKVIFVFEHFRHGARSPSRINNNDLDKLYEKWNGIQELTNLGLRQHYLLGNFIRNNYPNLINYEKYNPKEIEVLSTITNRTIMSARAQLYGMFIKSKSKEINGNQNKTSIPYYLEKEIENYNLNNKLIYPDNFPEEIPVHIVDIKDKLFQFEKKSCPNIKNIKKKNKKRKEIKDFLKRFNKTFGEQLLQIYNISNDSNYFTDYENVNDICIAATMDIFDGRNISFLNNNKIDITLLNNMSWEFFELKTTLVNAKDKEKLLGYAGSSVLIRKILSYMEKILDDIKNNKNDSPKLVLLSSHDTAIVNMEDLLNNLFDVKIIAPSFSANYIFELVKENEEYMVNLVFNNEILKTVKYSEFESKIKNKAWTFEKTGLYCGFLKEKDENSIWFLIVTITSLSISIVLIIFTFLIIKIDNKKIDLITE